MKEKNKFQKERKQKFLTNKKLYNKQNKTQDFKNQSLQDFYFKIKIKRKKKVGQQNNLKISQYVSKKANGPKNSAV